MVEVVGKFLHYFVTLVALTLFLCFQGHCYTVKVVTKRDNDKNDVEYFDIVDQEIPPFSWQVDEYTDDHFFRTEHNGITFAQGVKVSGVLGNVRHKRSLHKFNHQCIHSENTSRLVTLDVDETIHLPCHSCSEHPREVYKSKQWFKLDMYPSSEGLYHIKELVSDTHDDEHLNRITTSLDHTLIIKNAKQADTGSYICKQITNKDDRTSFLDLRLAWNELAEFIAEESKISHYYHVDVIDLEAAEVVDTSPFSSMTPLKPQKVTKLNIEVVTIWYPWSACSVCDATGMRKRFGLCTVRKLNKTEPIPDNHLEHILKLNTNGIPCHSELLGEYPDEKWLSRPNEVQMSECFEHCRKSNKHRQKRGIPLFLVQKDKEKDKDQKGTKPGSSGGDSGTKNVKVTIGKYTILKCPDVKLRRNVLWVNGTKLVSARDIIKENNQGTKIDMFGHLHFISPQLSDSGVYTCWLKGDLKLKYVFTVVEDARTVNKRYTLYLLYSFVGDFVVFIVLAFIKHCKRSAQKRRKQAKPVPESSSSDDTTSSSDDSDDSSSSDSS